MAGSQKDTPGQKHAPNSPDATGQGNIFAASELNSKKALRYSGYIALLHLEKSEENLET
jgi:hypothetical protein